MAERKRAREGAGGEVVRPPRVPEIALPPLRPFGGGAVTAEGDYDGVVFDGLDLAGQDGRGATFLDCALRGCGLDGIRLGRARLLDSELTGVRGVGTDLADAELRDVALTDARLGGTQLSGAVLTRVRVTGGKIDFLNLRQARLTDVIFEGCVLVEPDLAGARLGRVSFAGCELRGADLTGATLRDVDLRGAASLDIARGEESLSGAVITPAQLLDLAPRLAARLGVRVST